MEFVEISKLLTYKKGKPPIKKSLDEGEELPYLTPEYLRGKNLPEMISKDLSSVVVNDGDLILLWDGSNAGEVFKAKRGILSSTMVVIESASNFNKDFLYYVLKNKENYLKGQTSGSGIPHVDKEILGNIKVGLFEENEQTVIAEVLSKIDSAIEKTNRLIEKQKRIKQGLMQDLLTKGIDEHGNIRNEKTHRFKDSPLGRIPEDWRATTLKTALNYIDAGKSPTCLMRPAGSGEWGILKVSAIRPEGFRAKENKAISSKLFVNQSYEVKDGDLLISRANTYELVGIACLVRNPPSQLMLCDKTLRLNIDKKFANAEFIFHVLQTPNIRSQIEINATGSSGSMKNISQQSIENFLVALPEVDEQEKAIQVLNGFTKKIEILTKERHKLEKAKQGLMQDLLTGKKSVENLIEI